MQIQYNNKTVEKQCTNLRIAKKDFSDKVAQKLHKLVNFIESADNLASVIAFPTYHFHDLKGDREGEYALDIDGRRGSYRLIVCFDDRITCFDRIIPNYFTILGGALICLKSF